MCFLPILKITFLLVWRKSFGGLPSKLHWEDWVIEPGVKDLTQKWDNAADPGTGGRWKDKIHNTTHTRQ